ncbi:MAG: S8 family serine peptidase [Acidobacteriota bacterium]
MNRDFSQPSVANLCLCCRSSGAYFHHLSGGGGGWPQASTSPGDPGRDNVRPPLEDSSWTPGDPGRDNVRPPLEDSSAGPFDGPGAGSAPGVCSVCGGPLVGLPVLALPALALPSSVPTAGAEADAEDWASGTRSGFVILRLVPGLVPRPDAEADLDEHARRWGATGLRQALAWAAEQLDSDGDCQLTTRPLIDLPSGFSQERTSPTVPRGNRETFLDGLTRLEKEAATGALPPLHSLTSYWRVDARPAAHRLDDLVERFNALPEVDLAYAELQATETNAGGAGFTGLQDFLDDAPVGISGTWAQAQVEALSTTKSATLYDCEQGWILSHHELAGSVAAPLVNHNRHGHGGYLGHHGTAVLGEMVGSSRLRGPLRKACRFATASHFRRAESTPFGDFNGNVAEAIVGCLLTALGQRRAGVGDLLLLEVQRGRRPTELDPADRDAIRLAVSCGVVVVEAAGNGGYDLDRLRDPEGRRSLDRRGSAFVDSGAILVGAAEAALPHDRASFSNYGSRVDCFAWGEGVTSGGYGDFDAGATAADLDDFYTNTFNGTSSAAPIIATAAALVQCLHYAEMAAWLSPLMLRRLLSEPDWGTPQGPGVGGFIGVMPDLRRVVGRGLGLAAEVYQRRFVGDDGFGSSLPQGASSCPDVLVLPLPVDSAAEQAQDEASGELGPWVDDATPGGAVELKPGDDLRVLVRARNRGALSGDSVRVSVWPAPVATLLTPDRWYPALHWPGQVGLDLETLITSPGAVVPAGDQLAPVAGFRWQVGPDAAAGMAWVSYLRNSDDAPPPPLTSRDFDRSRWWRYVIGGHGYAIRNLHAIDVSGPQEVELSFEVTGAPDQSRRFDLEVIRRLPSAAAVRLAGPAALIQSLRQRRPWISVSGSSLELPAWPRLRFRDLRLPVAACLPAKLVLPAGDLEVGHEVAIRQLWRGREVGRITWRVRSA